MGDSAGKCQLCLFTDASFAGDLRDSKSTSGAILVLMGPHTFVPISWFAKKQGAVSHSSSEAEVIALDAAVRMEGLPALLLWDKIIEIYSPNEKHQFGTSKLRSAGGDTTLKFLQDIDYVPCNLPISDGSGRLMILEDNDAVIKMTIKGRSPNMRHVARTHRVDLDFLFERLQKDPGVFMRYINTKQQLADLLTKG